MMMRAGAGGRLAAPPRTINRLAIPSGVPVMRLLQIEGVHTLDRHMLAGAQQQHLTRRLASGLAAVPSGMLSLPIDRDLEVPLQGFDSIADALADLRAGKFLVVLDDEDRENEGDLIIAADKITTEAMAFLVEYSSGVVCIGMEGADLDRLRLPLMVSSAENEESMYTAFTITVDLRDGISTGISAADRAKTILHMANASATAADFRRPGHIFPLRCRPGGVLVRPGHTEAAVDLSRLAGSSPMGVLCEIVNKADGSMARAPQLLKMASEHGLRCITIADLIRYRLRHEQLVKHTSSAALQTMHGALTVHTFTSAIDGTEHVAIVAGNIAEQDDVLAHVHCEGAVADMLACVGVPGPSGVPLNVALQNIAAAGRGVVVVLRGQTAHGVSLPQELQSIAAAAATTSAEGSNGASGGGYVPDLRDYGLAAQMLRSLQVGSMHLMSDDSTQLQSLRSCGLKVQIVQQQQQHANGSVTPKLAAQAR